MGNSRRSQIAKETSASDDITLVNHSIASEKCRFVHGRNRDVGKRAFARKELDTESVVMGAWRECCDPGESVVMGAWRKQVTAVIKWFSLSLICLDKGRSRGRTDKATQMTDEEC